MTRRLGMILVAAAVGCSPAAPILDGEAQQSGEGREAVRKMAVVRLTQEARAMEAKGNPDAAAARYEALMETLDGLGVGRDSPAYVEAKAQHDRLRGQGPN